MIPEEIVLEGYPFKLVGSIELNTDRNGNYFEHNPAYRYHDQSMPLNPHGHKQFCKFRLHPIAGNEHVIHQQGVYAAYSATVKYLGKTEKTLINRFDNGYGNISPKKCFSDGNSTNCHINHEVLEASKLGDIVSVY